MAPHFVAGFETDGVVRRAAPIIKYLSVRPMMRLELTSKRWGGRQALLGNHPVVALNDIPAQWAHMTEI